MKYDRFWDIHLTANNNYYDWAGDIKPMAQYQADKMGCVPRSLVVPAATEPGYCFPLSTSILHPPLSTMDKGVVASMVKVGQLNEAASSRYAPVIDSNDNDAKALVAWVTDNNYKGKIRLTAHGDKAGHMGMYDSSHKNFDQAEARNLAKWLINNGLKASDSTTRPKIAIGAPVGGAAALAVSLGVLKPRDTTTQAQPGGLLTVALCICSGAFGNWSDDATIPAVDQVAREFFFRGIHGISVTGTIRSSVIVPVLNPYKFKKEFGDFFKLLHEGKWSSSAGKYTDLESALLTTSPSTPWRKVLETIQGYQPKNTIPETREAIHNLDSYQATVLYAKILVAQKYDENYGAYKVGQWLTERLDRQGYIKASAEKVKAFS